jgi:hypothetical protein
MTVAGNLRFQSDAIYLVQVTPPTASFTNVTGTGNTATLAGTVQANFSPSTFFERSYPILTAAGGLIGAFNFLATAGLPPDFQAGLSYVGNTAFLNLRAQLVPEEPPEEPPPPPPPPGSPPPPPLPSFTVNQLNVGHAIDNFFNNGGALPPAFVSLFNLSTEGRLPAHQPVSRPDARSIRRRPLRD